MAVKKDKNIQNLDTVGAYEKPVTPPEQPKTNAFFDNAKNLMQQYSPTNMANTIATAAKETYDKYYKKPDNLGDNTGDNNGYYIPTYTSPTAGAQYSYNGTRPTWNGYQGVEPTYTWDQQAPTWSWDDSGRPGAFEWDDSGRPGEFTYDQAAPAYTNAYQDRINAMVDQILNRPNFSYDYTQDPLYAQYADAYTRNGTQAMNDTLAQVSARTGGLASSYASNAAQQQYNSYMNALNDKIPELYQLAYGMYQDEGNTMRNNLSMLQGLENTDYGRYMDALGQYNTDRNLAYNVWNSGLNQYNQDRNFAYNQYADQLAQYNQDRNFSYGQYQDALNQYNNDRNFSFDQYQTALNQYNNNRNFDYGVYADALSQYNTDRSWDYNLWADNIARQEAAAKAAYNSQVAQAKAAAGSGSSGSGSNATSDQARWQDPYALLKAQGITDEGQALSYLNYLGIDNAKDIAKAYASWASSNTSSNSNSGDIEVRNTSSGYTFMGKEYKNLNSLASAINNANLSNSDKQRVRESLLRNGVLTDEEYNQLY